jgi:hypothetical protein
LLLATTVCACGFPHSQEYAPRSPEERQLFVDARRDVFPNDVRANLSQHRSELVLWTGIIKEVRRTNVSGKPGIEVLFEHHYWDFVEDYSVQSAIAFLSPRGEGMFKVQGQSAGNFAVDEMALVYGNPERIDEDGKTVILRGRYLSTLPRPLYATDVWDYGRDYVLRGDRHDFKVLRVPLN